MSQLVNQQAHQIVSQGPECFAILRTRPQHMCTYQYTKKNNHTTRMAFAKAYANGACIFLTTSVPEMLYAWWEHEVAAIRSRNERHGQATFQTCVAIIRPRLL